MQTYIALFIVAASFIYLIWILYKSINGKGKDCCGHCTAKDDPSTRP
ncbi:MAG: hypothetical protein Q8Q08_04455 [Candidatus Omnitrophota bacterium]|nr:hypothetical protein [Candidatus Omnitrophota bacterium]MDZ4242581.1 hypothetical protein [Candidatus Omnitrophota bacterium]